MKFITVIALSFMIALSLNAQKTLKRYRSISGDSIDNNLVEIFVNSTSASSTTDILKFKTIFDLTDKGQQAAISGKTNNQISELLNKKFLLDQSKKNSVIDLTTINIRITFSISRMVNYSDKKKLSAYDRIENLNYSFKLDPGIDKKVIFTKWNKYTTEYGTLDIGTLEYNQSFSASLDVTGKIGASASSKNSEKEGDNTSELTSTLGSDLSGTAKTAYNTSRKENQNIKYSFLQLTGSIEEREFNIHQQGTRETDLAGNVSIDLSVKVPEDDILCTSFTNLFKENNVYNSPELVQMTHTRYYIPDTLLLKNGVKGILSYDFVVRHILKKANTFPEFDDKICFIKGNNSKSSTLIKSTDLKVPVYFIKLELPDKIQSLTFTENNKNLVIHFLSYIDALDFKKWLLYNISNMTTDSLLISGKTISFDGISLTSDEVKQNTSNILIDGV